MTAPARDPRPVAQVVAEEGVARAIGLKHVAGILFTYRCTLACKHCCFNSSPTRPAVFTPVDDCVEYLRQLHATDRVVHIAGGEAMLYYPQLLEICRRADEQGIAPHFIETNATFAVNDGVVRTRLSELKDAGVHGLLISADPYHQLQCPPDRFWRCRRIAREVFGPENVITGGFAEGEVEEFAAIARDPERLAQHTRAHPPMLSGRAGEDLARYFPDRPIAELKDEMWHGGAGTVDCSQEFTPETMWEIHIDPYGNVQTCCGVIVGNAKETPVPGLMARGFLGRSPVVDAIYHGGPPALLELAKSLGYEERAGYPQKCGLCWEVRKFLRPHFPDAIGPAEVYEEE